ncbi:vacuolar protein-sorting-associated protein 37-like protein 1 [Senna tora]|uniref:Vacuolar protein-sorting-associated protein 37-like protein 1 n=1 Tax=Senna tora TaxID=362788 RepID=A0A834VZZ1_9FABA|nr:vacuolar protein-sorting-associated protein 37-like protein 1 [Senna tora]
MIFGSVAETDIEVVVIPNYSGSPDRQQSQPRPQDSSTSTQSWYPPSVATSPSSSRPATPSGASSSTYGSHRPTERLQSPSHVSPTEAAGIIAVLKDKSVDELRKLLSEKDAYQQFLLSLDQVKIQNNCTQFCAQLVPLSLAENSLKWDHPNSDMATCATLKDELCKETTQLAEENLQKEPRIMELKNQCRIIRTTELAAAQEKLNELEKQKEETLKSNSPASLLQQLQEAMNKTEEESENVHQQLLDREIDLATFMQKYKKLRTNYHKKALIHLAAKTSSA